MQHMSTAFIFEKGRNGRREAVMHRCWIIKCLPLFDCIHESRGRRHPRLHVRLWFTRERNEARLFVMDERLRQQLPWLNFDRNNREYISGATLIWIIFLWIKYYSLSYIYTQRKLTPIELVWSRLSGELIKYSCTHLCILSPACRAQLSSFKLVKTHLTFNDRHWRTTSVFTTQHPDTLTVTWVKLSSGMQLSTFTEVQFCRTCETL